MHRIDGPGATKEKRFTEGDPVVPIPPTTVTADWLNMVQDELENIVTAAGVNLDKSSNHQVLDALQSLITAKVPTLATVDKSGLAPKLAADHEVRDKKGDGLVSARQLPQILDLATTTTSGLAPRLATDLEVKEKRGEGLVSAKQLLSPVELTPKGVIVMWSGAEDAIPSGWVFCNGQNGTPDLRDRFIAGAGQSYTVGTIGGSVKHTHTIGVGNTTLTEEQMPHHSHVLYAWAHTESGSGQITGGRHSGRHADAVVSTTASGGNAAHSHSASSSESDHCPPFYALAFIMKL